MMLPDNASLYRSSEGYSLAQTLYQDHLDHITVPYEAQSLQTPFGETHLLIAGDQNAPSVVLLHGLALFAPHWYRQMNALASNYHIIAPDIIGSMGQSVSTRPQPGGSAYGEWLNSLLVQLNISHAHFIGISFGAWLILKLAQVTPQKIASAILMSPAGFTRPNWRLALRLLPIMLKGQFQSPEAWSRAFLRQTQPPGYEPSDLSVRVMALVLAHHRRQPVPGRLSDAELQALTAPTCILVGEHERAFLPQHVIRRAKGVLPNLKSTKIVPDAGHGMHNENPKVVNDTIRQWLAEYAQYPKH